MPQGGRLAPPDLLIAVRDNTRARVLAAYARIDGARMCIAIK
jgi:hypothetical protein